MGFIMLRLAQVVYPAQCFGNIPGFLEFFGHFFKRVREPEGKLCHVVYEVWLVSYLFFSFQILYFLKWIITSIGQSKHMRVTRFNPLWVSDATDRWAYNIDIGSVNAVVFLDLKEAFDTVDHHILLSKLHLYDLTGVSHRLFSSYLDNRTQKCVVNGSLSECCPLKCGIPQETKLGPLFLLYINDVPNCLSHSLPRMYAYDTHLTYSNGNIHSVQSSLNRTCST